MHYRAAQDNCRLIMGPSGHIAEPQTTEEHDEVTKNAKNILGYRLFLMRSTVFFFSIRLKFYYPAVTYAASQHQRRLF